MRQSPSHSPLADVAAPILGFSGENQIGSNFYPSPVFGYPTVEHAFVAAKTLDPVVQQVVRCMETPGRAKRLGSAAVSSGAKRLQLTAKELVAISHQIGKENTDALFGFPQHPDAIAFAPRLVLRDDWDQIRIPMMETLLREKFFVHQECAAWLSSTGQAPLVETNTWGDRFWGVCNGVGENHLGLLLMQVRGELAEMRLMSQVGRLADLTPPSRQKPRR